MVSRGAAGGAHSRSTIADVLLKESWVATFLVVRLSLNPFLVVGQSLTPFLVPKTVGLDQSTGAQPATLGTTSASNANAQYMSISLALRNPNKQRRVARVARALGV